MNGSGGRTPGRGTGATPSSRRRSWARGTTAVVAIGLVGALGLAGCSDDATTLDVGATEAAVAEVVASRVDPEITATTCPDDLELEEGGTFTCTLSLALTPLPAPATTTAPPTTTTAPTATTFGPSTTAAPATTAAPTTAPSAGPEAEVTSATLRVEVTQVDVEGRLDVVLLDAVVSTAAVVEDLQDQLKVTFERSFLVSCGTVSHRVVKPGGTFTCRARDAAGPRTVKVTVVDVAGTLRYDVLT